MPIIHRSLFLVAAAAFAAGPLGCQSTPRTETAAARPSAPVEPWSTKHMSVLARDPAPGLNLPAPYVVDPSADFDTAAGSLLREAADAENPLFRANAIEALAAVPGTTDQAVRFGLGDANRGVRFAAAMVVGEYRLMDVAPLVEPLLLDPSPSVRAAAIFALHTCGRNVDPTPLADMLSEGDAEVRANVIWIIGKMGDRSALPMLRELARPGRDAVTLRDRLIGLQLAEAMVRLGDDSARELLHAALFAPAEQAELTALATQIVADLGDRSAVPVLKQLARPGETRVPAEVQLAAARALARLAPASELAEVPLAFAGSESPELRQLVASTLGTLGDPTHLAQVAGMMQDPDPRVQIAAAGAVLALTP
jgi:HEAT repeat protein